MKWSAVVEKLERFYETRGRFYPWRHTLDLYRLFVAEVLLQKTPAERCVRTYEKIVEKYPSPEELANADRARLEEELSSLGLIKRAKWIKSGSRLIGDLRGEKVTEDVLTKVPGIGKYSARAILVSMLGSYKLPVDANVKRVLERLGVPRDEWNYLSITRKAFYGLLDLAREVCKTRDPSCEICPLRTFCGWANR